MITLQIDGKKVASESCALPHDITLTATLEHNGVPHTVVAKSDVHFPSADITIAVDGQALTLDKTQ